MDWFTKTSWEKVRRCLGGTVDQSRFALLYCSVSVCVCVRVQGCDGGPSGLVGGAEGAGAVGGAGGLRLRSGLDVGPGASC